MNRRLLVVSLSMLGLVAAGWVWVNPSGRFGICKYGLTTYSRVPLPVLDLQVRQDGAVRWILKTHEVSAARLAWLLDSKPEILIVGLGWHSAARVSASVSAPPEVRIIPLPTGEALSLFNRLRAQGARVAIHVHSTC